MSERFSWGLALAGGVVAAAVTFFLLTLGAGFGLMLVGPDGFPRGFLTGGAIYFFVAQAFGFVVGGHIVGRLLGPVVESHRQEEIRAAIHGLVVWALTILATLALIGVAGHATATLYGVGRTGDTPGRLTAMSVDRLFRPVAVMPNPSVAAISQQPARPAPDSARAEAGRLIEAGPRLAADDRARLVDLVAQTAAVSRTEATGRVAAAESFLTQRRADEAAAARRTLSAISLWTGFALLFGAVVAMVAAVTARLENDQDSPWSLFGFHRGWR
jgi:hypothetical protein